jgi:hypothetical protein
VTRARRVLHRTGMGVMRGLFLGAVLAAGTAAYAAFSGNLAHFRHATGVALVVVVLGVVAKDVVGSRPET